MGVRFTSLAPRSRRWPFPGLPAICGIVFLSGFGLPSAAHAHDDLHVQIAAATTKLEETPEDARLYLKRGELYRLHEEWDASLADFELAHRLEPTLDFVQFARARTLLAAGWPRSALVVLDGYLALHEDHGPARLARARALVALGRNEEAIDAYDAALAALETRLPEHYLGRADACRAAGPAMLDRAIAGLDAGIADLGPIVQLQLRVIEIESARGAFDAALSRLNGLLESSNRKEPWLARRGELLERAGRPADAAGAYRAALTAIESLPLRHRRTEATTRLEETILAALRRLPEP